MNGWDLRRVVVWRSVQTRPSQEILDVPAVKRHWHRPGEPIPHMFGRSNRCASMQTTPKLTLKSVWFVNARRLARNGLTKPPNSISSPMNGGGDQRCGADEESAEDEVAAKVRPIHRRVRSVGNERRFCSSVSQVISCTLIPHSGFLRLTHTRSRYTHSMLCLPITTHARAVSHNLLLIQAPCMPAPLPHLCSSYRAASVGQ